jgi:hypothetical protein
VVRALQAETFRAGRIDHPQCPASVLDANRPCVVEVIQGRGIEGPGDRLDVADAANPAVEGGMRVRQCCGEGRPVRHGRRTACDRLSCCAEGEKVQVGVVQSWE